jgi:hypothetical protein
LVAALTEVPLVGVAPEASDTEMVIGGGGCGAAEAVAAPAAAGGESP